MKILITGAAGYIGTQLIESLSQLPEINEITAYDNLSRGNYNLFIGREKISDKVKFVNGEVLDGHKLKEQMKDCDAVIHLAAEVTTPFADTNHHLFEQVNHWGTANVADAAEESGVKRFIYFSSASVYGFSDRSFSLRSEPKPVSIYGISKLRGEKHVARLRDKMKVTIFRCANVFGYNSSMRFDAVINRFMFDANFAGRITVQGDGSQMRTFVHIDNVNRAVEHIITDENAPELIHLADRNESIVKVTDALEEIFPDMERIFVSQHLKLRSLKLDIDEDFNRAAGFEDHTLPELFEGFKKNFRF